MTQLKCFYCPATMDGYSISVKCPNCPNAPTYNEFSPNRVFFNDVKKDGSYRAEYNIRTNTTQFFVRKKVLSPISFSAHFGSAGNLVITPGNSNTIPSVGGDINVRGGVVPDWHLLIELQFQITPTNINEILDRCLRMKSFL